jgi:hypothetical protein
MLMEGVALQGLLLSVYLDGSDPVLWKYVSQLLLVVAVLELFDGLQTVLGGVVQVLSGNLQKSRHMSLTATHEAVRLVEIGSFSEGGFSCFCLLPSIAREATMGIALGGCRAAASSRGAR